MKHVIIKKFKIELAYILEIALKHFKFDPPFNDDLEYLAHLPYYHSLEYTCLAFKLLDLYCNSLQSSQIKGVRVYLHKTSSLGN